MTSSTGATIRADINGVVMEAFNADTKFIGSKVMPMVPVDAKSGEYPKVQIAKGELLTPADTTRSTGASYGKITRQWTSDTYTTVDRGLKEHVDDADEADMSRFFSLTSNAAKNVLRNVMLSYELRVQAATFNTSNYGAATNSAVAYTVANAATIDFPLDVTAAISRVDAKGGSANAIVLSDLTLNRIRMTTKLQSFCRGALPSDATLNLTASGIQAAFADYGIQYVFVGRSYYNTANKAQTASLSSVWGTTYVWVGQINQSSDLFNVGAGATLVWNKEGGLFVSETYRDEDTRSTIVRVRQNTAEKCIDSTNGTLIATQYS